MVYIQEVLTRIDNHAPTDKMCTYCSMKKQHMKEDIMIKSLTWGSKSVTYSKAIQTLYFNDEANDKVKIKIKYMP